MSKSITLTPSIAAPDGAISGSIVRTSEGWESMDIPLAASATPLHIDLDFLPAGVKGFQLLSTVNCTLKTNSSSAPDDTIPLRAGEPLPWVENWFYDNPFTENVADLYAVNTSSPLAAGVLTIGLLRDRTP